MKYEQIFFSGHAIRQMFQREIAKNDVIEVIRNGEVIVEYTDDTQYPSCLILGFINNKPIHVVFALDQEKNTGAVITAYIPDAKLWSEDFKKRRDKK